MIHRHTLDGEYALETILSIRTGSRKRGKQSRIGTRRNSKEEEERGKRGEMPPNCCRSAAHLKPLKKSYFMLIWQTKCWNFWNNNEQRTNNEWQPHTRMHDEMWTGRGGGKRDEFNWIHSSSTLGAGELSDNHSDWQTERERLTDSLNCCLLFLKLKFDGCFWGLWSFAELCKLQVDGIYLKGQVGGRWI